MQATRDRFYREVTEVIWHELNHQNSLPRAKDERSAQDLPGFLTLARCYVRRAEDKWVQGEEDAALHELRKLAAICVSAMIHCGVRDRKSPIQLEDEAVRVGEIDHVYIYGSRDDFPPLGAPHQSVIIHQGPLR